MYDSIYPPDYYILEHHGILGQKWGVRRYQNSDGSLTPAGRSRYITANKHAIDWATYKIGSDKAESKMGRHATLRSMTNLNMRRQAAREVGEGLSARDKASGMYRVYNRRKIANGVAAVASAGNTSLNAFKGNNSNVTYTPMFGDNAGKKITYTPGKKHATLPPAYVDNPDIKNQSPFSPTIYTYGKNPYGSRR